MTKLSLSGFELATQWSEAQYATIGLRRPPLEMNGMLLFNGTSALCRPFRAVKIKTIYSLKPTILINTLKWKKTVIMFIRLTTMYTMYTWRSAIPIGSAQDERIYRSEYGEGRWAPWQEYKCIFFVFNDPDKADVLNNMICKAFEEGITSNFVREVEPRPVRLSQPMPSSFGVFGPTAWDKSAE